ncbi:MAG: methyltransferase domain-containing protein [Anaerolineales bacterium]|nr:methyltransferase domain-containing protein [Anaerolineales bacterium]
MGINLHNDLIEKNHNLWSRKPLLRIVYNDLYQTMKQHLSNASGKTVELGSGMGSIRETLPDCILTDLFPYPWIDQVENAYQLSFKNASVSNLLMVDVFHHFRYPDNALQEFHRVLNSGGRVIMMEPALSLLGYIVYGLLHVEPIGKAKDITWFAPEGWDVNQIDYYAAQGNATRIFVQKYFSENLSDWKIVRVERIAALAYAASGGYSGPQLYPTFAYRFIKWIEKLLRFFPALFATRLLVVLEKK